MSNQATYGIAITADDKTAKGVKSAEKRIGLIPKHTSAINKRSSQLDDQLLERRSRGAIRTFGKVEQAASRAFGGRSLTSGFSTRLSAIKDAASAAGEGLGEAATAGGALESAMGAVGVAAGATIGVLTAAGYAAYKLADGWAKGASSIGRTADIIGVASQQLQEFNAAAERQGVDKGTATSAAAGLSQSLNDARYGRNNDVIQLLNRLGLKLQLNQDGTVNTGAMLPVIADAVAKQNSSGRRTMARILGFGDAAIPVFAQGGAALSADMSDADKTAYIASGTDIARAKRIQRKQAIVGQMKDRVIGLAGSATADAGEPLLDKLISAGSGAMSGASSFGGIIRNRFAPAAEKIDRAADRMVDAAEKSSAVQAVQGAVSGTIASIRAFFERQGWSTAQASGITANLLRESHLNPTAKGDGGHAFGLGQWHEDRQANFRRVFGHDIREGSLDEQLRFVQWELTNSEQGAGNRLHGASSERDAAGIISRFYERPADREGEARTRSALAEQIAAIPVKVEVHLPNAPAGTKTKVTAGTANPPAVSHAMQY